MAETRLPNRYHSGEWEMGIQLSMSRIGLNAGHGQESTQSGHMISYLTTQRAFGPSLPIGVCKIGRAAPC